MSDIKFACPHCSQHIACDPDYGDLPIDCPGCGNGMVVPRLTAPNSTHPAMVIVASTPAAKHVEPPPVPALRAWTEQEWAQHSRDLGRPVAKTAPHWILSLFGTLIALFVLRINHAGAWPIIVCLILGGVLSGILCAKDRKSAGAYTLIKGVSIALAVCVLLPLAALGILFIGCAVILR